jgi:1-acyl-sn-glycerol-3-phosphate acyltransferase
VSAALPALPANAPQYPPSLFAALCRGVLRVLGWRLTGAFPDVPKLVVIAAPHSSNWDAIIGMLFKVGMRLQVRFIGKREAFVWPLGSILRALGGIPIDRSAAHGVVETIQHEFATRERFWFALAPEGTRKKVHKWKSGFWHIAHAAGVPILPVYFHYPEKTIGVGPLFQTSDDVDADVARIREFYRPWQGKNHGTE